MVTRQPIRRSWRLGLCSALVLGVAACGGGGGDGGGATAPPPPNLAPTASAGDAQSVDAGTAVALDGSGSFDSDGTITRYSWLQSDGPTVTLEDADTATARFTAPDVGVDTDLVFGLTVTDNDGAAGTASVTITVMAGAAGELFSVSGRLQPSASQGLDGDTNDPFNPLQVNDDPASPQRIGNPTTLGGYVNEDGAGAEGRSQIAGDPEDYFSADLLEGQTINLLVAEFQDADADLYLYDSDASLVDFSIETGLRETIVVPATATYVINVSIFSGATNYTLTIGSSLAPVARRDEPIVAGQAIVTFDERGELAAARAELARSLQLRELGGGPRRARLLALDEVGANAGTWRQRLGDQGYRKAQFGDPGRARHWETLMSIKMLARQPGVASAEPNYRLMPQAAVNDEAYPIQWHYPLIFLPGAWETSTGDSSVTVAVVDTGILQNHPDLAGQLVEGYDFIRDAGEAADGDGIDPDPEESIGEGDPGAVNFHGTHVAGTVAARGNNRIGVAGVAYGARVMPLRAITASGGTLYDVNQAVRYAAALPNDSGTVPARAADIINLSLSGGGFSPSSQALYNQLRDLGITVVAAAGNEGSTLPAYPASYDNVIAVSAVDAQQQVTDYSNTGSGIDIAAPGGDGSVDLNGDGYPDGVLSTGASDGEFAYTFLSGTSMAAPHVAGVLALMKSVNPALDADDFDRLLVAGALSDDLGPAGRDDAYGHGVINARRAIDAALRDAGTESSVPPRLAASTTALNFGSAATRLDVQLRNGGGGSLGDVALAAQVPWITVTAAATDAAGLGRYAVRVERGSLGPGVYETTLTASSDANSIDIRVLVAVADALDSDLGQLYLLLYDPATDEVVVQTVASRDGDGYRFEFPPAPAGSYQVFAGTDLDNDLLICDPGEACGSYLTIDQPLILSVDRDRDDIMFPIEYLIALPVTQQASGAAVKWARSLTRRHTTQ